MKFGSALAYGGSLQENSANIIGNVVGNTLAENLSGPSRSELELQWQEDAKDAAMFEALGKTSPALGDGLRATQDQAAAFGPRYSAEHDFSIQRSDYSLVDEGQKVTLPRIDLSTDDNRINVSAGDDRIIRDWDPEGISDTAKGPMSPDVPLADLKDEFARGYRDSYGQMRSVMDKPETAGEIVGQFAGQSVDKTLKFLGDLSGYNSMNAAKSDWKAGNYVSSVLHGAQAFGEAGTTLLTLGTSTSARGTLMTAEELAASRAVDNASIHGANSAEATFGSAASNNYRATFFATNPELEGQVVVHHAVEQQVLNKFPGVVSEVEMHSIENLRGIPYEINSDIHLSQIRVEWNRFYKPFVENGTSPTQEQLLQKATEIDNKFGSQFNPPVR